jgi:YqaJ-like viral recombinase domain
MTIKHYKELTQGSDEWFQARCGLLTASEMKNIITPKTLKYSESKDERTHVYELAAQRITGYVEPSYISDDMLRGKNDEFRAVAAYNENYAGLDLCGFITNDEWGFTLGYSPDALVRGGGVIECKSRRQKFQVETIIGNSMPDDCKIQVQTGLLVSKEPWCDFITYCGGMPMFTLRILPDEVVQKAIIDAATTFHERLEKAIAAYKGRLEDKSLRFIETERVIEQEIIAA